MTAGQEVQWLGFKLCQFITASKIELSHVIGHGKIRWWRAYITAELGSHTGQGSTDEHMTINRV